MLRCVPLAAYGKSCRSFETLMFFFEYMRTNFSVNSNLDAKFLVETPATRYKIGVNKSLIAVLLSFFACSAHADAFFKLVGYQCDPQADRLILTYGAAANGEGQSMMEAKSSTQWDPWDLTEPGDEDHIKTTRTVTASCRLSRGTYYIQLGPIPGNFEKYTSSLRETKRMW